MERAYLGIDSWSDLVGRFESPSTDCIYRDKACVPRTMGDRMTWWQQYSLHPFSGVEKWRHRLYCWQTGGVHQYWIWLSSSTCCHLANCEWASV